MNEKQIAEFENFLGRIIEIEKHNLARIDRQEFASEQDYETKASIKQELNLLEMILDKFNELKEEK
jgi:hypothetical protein